MNIISKLYLNGSPQSAEDGSLAFAKNMKLDDDGHLVNDYGYENITALNYISSKYLFFYYLGQIIGLNNKIYIFAKGVNEINDIDYVSTVEDSLIIEYDEIEKTATEIKSAWKYSGGSIDGYVSTNISGEIILTIAEYIEGGSSIPLKHINLSYCNENDNESIYCQAPEVPITNLILIDTYTKTIPNGVYIFFIRYKIRKDVYTPWYLCSHPIFSGVSEDIETIQGGLKYINLHKDAAKSFIFEVSHVNKAAINLYSEFQLGFIITHDEATDARTWKSFNIISERVYFDYDNVEEANIDDLLATTYELYNVNNITSFKNKLYISNYIETDFNNKIYKDLAANIKIKAFGIEKAEKDNTDQLQFGDYVLVSGENKDYYDSVGIDNKLKIEEQDSVYKGKFINKDNIDYSVVKDFRVADTIVDEYDPSNNKQTVYFKFDWNSSYTPDIVIATWISDRTIGGVPFGQYPYGYENCFTNNFKINYKGTFGSYWKIMLPDDKKAYHPWYKKGLTFAFGSASNGAKSSATCYKNGVYVINKDTADYISEVPTWYAEDNNFNVNDSQKQHIFNVVSSELANTHRFGMCYLILKEGTVSYKLGYNEIMDDKKFYGYDYDGKNIIDYLDYNYTTDDTISKDFEDKITTFVNTKLTDAFVGISASGKMMVKVQDSEGYNKIIEISSAICVIKKFYFGYNSEDIAEDKANNYSQVWTAQLKSDVYNVNVSFGFKEGIVNVENNDSNIIITQRPSLMPHSLYNVYVHFVDSHNIISNGFFIDSLDTDFVCDSSRRPIKDYNDIINLGYTFNSAPNFPDNIKSFFFSIVNKGDIIIQGFNYKYDSANNLNILHSIEIDSLLYNLNDNITICKEKVTYNDAGLIRLIELEDITTKAKYYSSGDSNKLAFGNCGYIAWNGNTNLSNVNLYIRIKRNNTSEKNYILTKATPYLTIPDNHTYNTWRTLQGNSGFYNSYLCAVKKPNFDASSGTYVSGNDIYTTNRTSGTIKLIEFTDFINIISSPTQKVISNFNLNYLTTTEDINDKIFSIKNSSEKQVAKVLNSSTLSFIYELKPMYKDFMNKTFMPAEELYKTKFDNTIRVSNVLSDETFNNSVFKFEATNYYNIPADRGIIVKLFAIGNNIYVHTKNSFYKFDATHTITSTESDIKLQESEPFEVGITQIFDSQYGYGGINNKEAGCITFDSYFFYDVNSKHIFSYGGTGQVKLIDGNINKFINYYSPKYCRAIHDEFNKRILFNFYGDIEFTLSYNYKSNGFVSFHDLTLNKAFYSRTGVYSLRNNYIHKLFKFEEIDSDNIYGVATTTSEINYKYIIQDETAENKDSYGLFNISVICFPKQYLIEVLNYISYVANVITNTNKNNIIDLSINNKDLTNPVKALTINTDSCASIIVKSTVDDTARPNTLLDYKGFKYNKGFWNVNYFRNYKHIQNIYNYPKVIEGDGNNISDNQSLIYGRYFLLNFDFIDKPIKIESVQINTQNY